MTSIGPVSHRFTSQRLALHYLDWGNPDRPLLILVHGGQDHARTWDWVAQELRHDWHVVCPDLRGHGDSAWSPDGNYAIPAHVADLAKLIDECSEGPVSIVAHSLGGAIALRYAGIFPERVARLAVIEGLGISPLDRKPVAARWRRWIEQRHLLAERRPRRYPTFDQACARMKEANKHLTAEQARHLTEHGTARNEDGSYSWKFDNYSRFILPIDNMDEGLHELWHNIGCPVWLVHGADSWALHPATDGRADHFRHAAVTSYERAGHWVHHDRLDSFVSDLKAFLTDTSPALGLVA